MMYRKLLRTLGLLAISCLSSTVEVSHAVSTSTFTHSADFFAALGGAPLVTETYESLPLNSLIAAGSTVGQFTYSTFPAGTQGRIDNFYNRIGAQSLAADRPGNPTLNFFVPGESFSVVFAVPANAVGVFFNANPTPGDGDLFIAASVGLAGTGGPATNYDVSTLFFAGLISDTPFTSAVIGSLGAGQGSSFNVDNLSFSPTPEPATLILFSSTVVGLGLARWRQCQRKRQQP
jgi:hypothetical protein